MVDAGYVKSYYIDKKIHYGSIQVRVLSWLQKLKVMKIYIHEGKGHYIGSCVIVVSDNLENARGLIRQSLDDVGLSNEELSITEKEISNGIIVWKENGDY